MTPPTTASPSAAVAWLGLAAFIPSLFGCTDRSLSGPGLTPTVVVDTGRPPMVNRNVDLLFVIDDSSSMRLSQDNLTRNFPVLMNALESLPSGLPNVHIAVVSTDMGAGDGSIAGCDATGGKNGIFQYTARGACTATGLDAGATYISNIGGVKNYTGNLSDTFACIAALGEQGCGFEQPLAALERALGTNGQPPPDENAGFLRPDAYLVIVLIGNEDDCSATGGSPLFDTTSSTTLDSALGPVANFRCNEFGHICDGAPPVRLAPNNDVNASHAYSSCQPSDGGGLLLNVAETAARIKAMKSDPAQVVVAAITGPAAPYVVQWKTPSISDEPGPWPVIAHSCTATDGSFADPSVRTTAFVNEFGSNGLVLPICDADFAPALHRIADKIIDRIGKPCIGGTVAKQPGTDRDDCTVVSTTPDGHGGFVQGTLAPCASTGGAGPCWQFAPGEDGCSGQSVTVVPDAAVAVPAWQSIRAQCAVCTPGVPDAARGCP